ncbi:4635_t:CDS:2 [Diversispora eburnea]|uniref:4635_t:CDS:1 n=1 Tax=Diversispora eburnea TaxID=1213867 RepID=A0A9N8W8C2_9GLOM|nr:4635_t:CDS:2 [Diversispora eburnea]
MSEPTGTVSTQEGTKQPTTVLTLQETPSPSTIADNNIVNVQPLPQTQARISGTIRGRGPGFTGGPGLFEVSPTGEILHESIPHSKELEHLAELKEVASEYTRGGVGVSKGSPASIAQTGIPPLTVQGMVLPSGQVDEEKLARELKEEAQQRAIYEAQHIGRIPIAGPASKVEEAAEKIEQIVKIDKGEERTPSPVQPPNKSQYGQVSQYDLAGGPYIQNPGGGLFSSIFSTVIPETGQIYHENIEQSKEFQHLSELKEVASERAKREVVGTGIPRGSTAAIAQSAMGKYASAIGDEIGVPALAVQGMVPIAPYEEEANIRAEYEKQVYRYLPITTPASKVDEAARKMEKVLRIDEGKEAPPNRASMQPPATNIGDETTAAELRKNELPTTFVGGTGGLESQRHVISSLDQEQRDKIQKKSEENQLTERGSLPLNEEVTTAAESSKSEQQREIPGLQQ